jgi:hypothetical protein
MRFLFALALAGCWHFPADYCQDCTIVEALRPTGVRIPRGTRAVVVLVHGVLGFGSEWTPVVDELRQHHNIAFVVLAYHGPWGQPIAPARSLLTLIQSALDNAPPETTQVLVLAHSAGGLIASWAVRHARVPAGRHLSLAKIACPPIDIALGYSVEEKVDTPLGFAVGGTREKIRPIPPGAEIGEYLTSGPHVPHGDLEGRPFFLGPHAGHNRILSRVAVPLIRAASDGVPPLLAHID